MILKIYILQFLITVTASGEVMNGEEIGDVWAKPTC